MGEQNQQVIEQSPRIAVDTIAGYIHVELEPESTITPRGHFPFFMEFLKTIGPYEVLLANHPLNHISNNAPLFVLG